MSNKLLHVCAECLTLSLSQTHSFTLVFSVSLELTPACMHPHPRSLLPFVVCFSRARVLPFFFGCQIIWIQFICQLLLAVGVHREQERKAAIAVLFFHITSKRILLFYTLHGKWIVVAHGIPFLSVILYFLKLTLHMFIAMCTISLNTIDSCAGCFSLSLVHSLFLFERSKVVQKDWHERRVLVGRQ